MKYRETIKSEPRRRSRRSNRCETCNLHGEPHVQVACWLRYSTGHSSESPSYFNAVTTMQTSTHSDDPQRHDQRRQTRKPMIGYARRDALRSTLAGHSPGPSRSFRQSLPCPLLACCQISVTSQVSARPSRDLPLRPVSSNPHALLKTPQRPRPSTVHPTGDQSTPPEISPPPPEISPAAGDQPNRPTRSARLNRLCFPVRRPEPDCRRP
jgi:hypothetical protein